jgi:TPR repeat protein
MTNAEHQMDDIELAFGAAIEIGRLYKESKTFCEETPVLSLTYSRGLAGAYCNSLDPDLTRESLSEKIFQLHRKQRLLPEELKHLRTLQLSGNKAAHPEAYGFLKHDFPKLAAESLGAARELIEQFYIKRDGRAPVYKIAQAPSGALKEMCIKAMLEREVDAMHLAGSFFLERAKSSPHLNVPIAENGYPLSARADIDQSMFWFKQAAEAGHATASYQYGYYLTQHLNVDDARLNEAEQYISSAARNKIADALVYVGNVSLYGSARFPKNEAYAREVYEEAAEQGHATALAQLGAMNAQGAGGAVDNEAAARYTLAAAKAGIPIGQFNMFAMYVKGIGVPQDVEEGIRYLKEAAAQGYPDAIFNLAVYIEAGWLPDRPVADAEAEFEKAMAFPKFEARAALYAAERIALRSNEIADLVKAASYLQICYSTINKDDPNNLKEKCLKDSKTVVGRIRAHMKLHGSDPSLKGDDIFTAALFDKECIPVVDKGERLRYLIGALKQSNTLKDKAANAEFMAREAWLTNDTSRRALERQRPVGIPPLMRQVMPSQVSQSRVARTAGRNDPCTCGSGLKFKKCHGS